MDSALRLIGSFRRSAAVMTVLELTLETSMAGSALAETVTALSDVVSALNVTVVPAPGAKDTLRESTTAPSFLSETV